MTRASARWTFATADVVVAALTTSQQENKIYSLTGPEALTFADIAQQLSRAVGRSIAFVDAPKAMKAALAELGFPVWQADGLLEEFAMFVAAMLLGSNQACVKRWADLLAHSPSSHVITL